jgi:hypothetical protein
VVVTHYAVDARCFKTAYTDTEDLGCHHQEMSREGEREIGKEKERERDWFVSLYYSSPCYMFSQCDHSPQVSVLWWTHRMGYEVDAASYLTQTEKTLGARMSK